MMMEYGIMPTYDCHVTLVATDDETGKQLRKAVDIRYYSGDDKPSDIKLYTKALKSAICASSKSVYFEKAGEK
jgi:hypothetical protein